MRKCPQLRGGGPRRRREERAPVCSSGWGWAGRDATWRAPSLFVKVADFLSVMLKDNAHSPQAEPVRARIPDGLRFSPFSSRRKIPSEAKSEGGENIRVKKIPFVSVTGASFEPLTHSVSVSPEEVKRGLERARAWNRIRTACTPCIYPMRIRSM